MPNLSFFYYAPHYMLTWLTYGWRKYKKTLHVIEFQLRAMFKSVRDEIRTHTAERPLPPQSSVSTNSTTRTFHRF